MHSGFFKLDLVVEPRTVHLETGIYVRGGCGLGANESTAKVTSYIGAFHPRMTRRDGSRAIVLRFDCDDARGTDVLAEWGAC